jgi:DNA-binding protein YbaB
MSDRSERPDPNQMMARLEAMQRQAEETLRRYEGMQEEISAANIEVFSDDGLVSVKLDGNGRISEIKIDEYAMRRRQSLAPTIIALVDQARVAHAEKSAELARQFLGADPALAAMLDRIAPERPR